MVREVMAMALVDDVLKSGNLVTAIALGAVAVIAWPVMRPLVRPLAKTAIKGGISVYREATRLYDGTMRGIGDLAAEAIAEIGPDLAEEAVEGAVEEVAADLVK
jgi:hypothetical protein